MKENKAIDIERTKISRVIKIFPYLLFTGANKATRIGMIPVNIIN
jgi:hypothetical protein